MKNNNNQIPIEALELLPWHAQDLLTHKEKTYMESALLKFPELQNLLKQEYLIIQNLKENEELFYLSSINSAEDRLDNLLRGSTLSNTIKNDDNIVNTQATKNVASIFTSPKDYIISLMSGNMTKVHYMGFAAVSTLSIALLFAFISPLIDKNNTFYPAYTGSINGKSQIADTTLLVGLNIDPQDPRLLKIIDGFKTDISEVPGKQGMYRMTLLAKPSTTELNELIEKLSGSKELIWFVGEAY